MAQGHGNMRQKTYDITGWTLFAIGCLVFIVQGLRNGEVLTLVGSVFFMVGVLVVLVPYCRTG